MQIKQTVQEILEEIYYTPSSVGSFRGVDRLYKEAKKVKPKITKKIVLQFLQSQPTYTLHKPFRKKFKRRKNLSSSIDHIWQVSYYL